MSSGTNNGDQTLAIKNTGNENNGNERLDCPLYGCKRVYLNQASLQSHLNDHNQSPALSIPGKVFYCSSIGCKGSFSSMQLLMEHMRTHYKPNIYFLCESCRAKLRSHKTLIKHLHTCSKVAKSKAGKVADFKLEPDYEVGPTVSLTGTTADPSSIDQGTQEQNLGQLSNQDSSGTPSLLQSTEPSSHYVSLPQTDSSYPPNLGLPLTMTVDEVHAEQQSQPQSLSQLMGELQSQSHPALTSTGLSPQPSPGPVNWRKKQGQSLNSRILWEHTRGRYRCVQCGQFTANRKDMTAHINAYHKIPASKPIGDTNEAASSPSKESEASTFTQL